MPAFQAVAGPRRLAVALGCGGDAFDTGPLDDRQRWEPDPPLPNPIPDSWPVRYETEVDHPGNYLYGTVVRTGPESIEFSIADQGVVATFRPAAELEVFC